MDEKALKTSWKQRVIILVIAILLIAGTVLTYVFIVINGSKEVAKQEESNELIEDLTKRYEAKQEEVNVAAEPLSDKYFKELDKYRSEVKAYNSASANSDGLKSKDLKEGSGKQLKEGDTNYYAYYIGWCPDGSIFDSSFNSKEKPTALGAPLDASIGLIEGWNQGVVGMKLGGVREIAIPGDLAYGEQQMCESTNTPLKFVVMAIEAPEEFKKLNEELQQLRVQLISASYGTSLE